jgi:transposase InsO family protein
MYQFTKSFVTSCDSCQKNKARHQVRLGTPILPDIPLSPWESMSVDMCGPFPTTKNGNDYIIGFIDNLTREAIIIPCKQTLTAKGAVSLFMKFVLSRTGIPAQINSDRGPQFIANFWQTLWKALGTKSVLSAPYHPQSNAYIERQNKTFIENIKGFINARMDDWEDYITPYEFAYNNSVHPGLGDTPFFLSHG